MCAPASLVENLLRRLPLLTIHVSASFADNACVVFSCWQCVRKLLLLTICFVDFFCWQYVCRLPLLTMRVSASLADNVMRGIILLTMRVSAFLTMHCVVFSRSQYYFGFSCWKRVGRLLLLTVCYIGLLTFCGSNSLGLRFCLFELTLSGVNPEFLQFLFTLLLFSS